MMAEIQKGSLRLGRMDGYAALPGSYPLLVRAGDRVSVTQWQFKYRGPAATLYVCWGIKGPGGSWPVTLLDGIFAYSQISVIENLTGTFLLRNGTCNAVLAIPTSFESLTQPVDTQDWISRAPTAILADVVGGVDLDNGILTLGPAPVSEITELNVLYQKL